MKEADKEGTVNYKSLCFTVFIHQFRAHLLPQSQQKYVHSHHALFQSSNHSIPVFF